MTLEKLRRKLFVRLKRLLHLVMPASPHPNLLFIFGCQRSGTTLLSRVFERDWFAKSYAEVSDVNREEDQFRIRLKPLPEVRNEIKKHPARLIVLKPLVESQRANEILAYFESSKAVWIYRNYRDVASSNLARFGRENGVADITQLLDGGDDNWRSEYVPTGAYELVRQLFADDLTPHDAAVLFWYARNALYFDLKLYQNPNVMLCRYESLVQDPETVVPAIYRFARCRFPGPSIIRQVHSRSVSKGKEIDLSPHVVEHAEHMLDKLDRQWSTQQQESTRSL